LLSLQSTDGPMRLKRLLLL